MKPNLIQKIVFILAWLCYLGAAGFAVAAFAYEPDRSGDPVHASFMASVIFFAGCGIVLHVIARTRLQGLVSLDDQSDDQ
jgi:hypothetical protein